MRISDWSSDVCSSDLLADINRSLPSWCAEPWVRQIRVANIRGQTVVVFSASASALVPLRHRSSTFLLWLNDHYRSEEHTSELQSLMRISYAVFCLKKKKTTTKHYKNTHQKTKTRK